MSLLDKGTDKTIDKGTYKGILSKNITIDNKNIGDKYRFFKTAVIMLVLILIIVVVDSIIFLSMDTLANMSKNPATTASIFVGILVLFTFGWVLWYFFNNESFDTVTSYVNNSIDTLMKNPMEKTGGIGPSDTKKGNQQSNYILLVRYFVYFVGMCFTGLFVYTFVSAYGDIGSPFSYFPALIISLLTTLLVINLISFLFVGIPFDLDFQNIKKNIWSVLMAFYFIFVPILIYYDPWKVIRKNIGIIIAFTVLFVALVFPLIYSEFYTNSNFNNNMVVKVIQYSLYLICSFGVSGLIIYLIYALLTGVAGFLSTDFGIFSSLVNVLLIVAGLALLYKFLVNMKGLKESPPIVRLFVNLFLYIPCLFSVFVDLIVAVITPGKDRGYLFLSAIMIVLLLLMYLVPRWEKKFFLQNGKLLINEPISLNKESTLSSYHDLNNTQKKKLTSFMSKFSNSWEKIVDTTTTTYNPYVNLTGVESNYFPKFDRLEPQPSIWGNLNENLNKMFGSTDESCSPTATATATTTAPTFDETTDRYTYRYAISSWIFLEANPPNMKPAYNHYVSLLNYGNKPNLMYNASSNTVRLVVDYKNLGEKEEELKEKLNLDEEGRRIIFEKSGILLQKWNHFVLNSVGGTLDIFINGELVGTADKVVPYKSFDNLTSGSDDGMDGGICNIVYYTSPLTKDQINIIYWGSKNKVPPVFSINE